MSDFSYRGGELFCEEVSLSEIAGACGTPVYVYSYSMLRQHCHAFGDVFAETPHLLCFSVKANSNIAILKLLGTLGCGADIVSGGELFRALRAGISPKKIVFSGVGKTRGEMLRALEVGVLCFNVESQAELKLLNQVAAEYGSRAPVSIRVNPDVDAQTHPYISTGGKESKFGISWTQAEGLYGQAAAMAHIEVIGIDCHIGSQLTSNRPFIAAAEKLTILVETLIRQGMNIRYVDVGGGLGISYCEPGEVHPPSVASYGGALLESLVCLKKHNITLICEPGRAIVGNSGTLLTSVLYEKSSQVKNFAIVDAAFNDLLRPALYDSYHSVIPVVKHSDRETIIMDVVGPICESGDILARGREMEAVREGELLAIGSVGAYGFSMSSNYNSRPRACEVLVRDDQYQVIRERETYEQLVGNESIPDFIE